MVVIVNLITGPALGTPYRLAVVNPEPHFPDWADDLTRATRSRDIFAIDAILEKWCDKPPDGLTVVDRLLQEIDLVTLTRTGLRFPLLRQLCLCHVYWDRFLPIHRTETWNGWNDFYHGAPGDRQKVIDLFAEFFVELWEVSYGTVRFMLDEGVLFSKENLKTCIYDEDCLRAIVEKISFPTDMLNDYLIRCFTEIPRGEHRNYPRLGIVRLLVNAGATNLRDVLGFEIDEGVRPAYRERAKVYSPCDRNEIVAFLRERIGLARQ